MIYNGIHAALGMAIHDAEEATPASLLNINTALDAIAKSKRIKLEYLGHTRIAEVHTLGITKKGEPAMRAYQVEGGSRSEHTVGWKPFLLKNVTLVELLDKASEAPREGYRRGDRFMAEIIAEI